MDKAIALLSGGLDSTVAAWLLRPAVEPVLALTVDYGQRAAAREAAAAYALARRLGVPHRLVALPWIREAAGSALTDPRRALPEPTPGELDDALAAHRSAAGVWVPNRNFSLIAVAATWAEVNGVPFVVCGFNREEARTFPDNSELFVERVNAALELSTRNHVRVLAPTQGMDKAEIVRTGLARDIPLELCWPCYDGGVQPCGRCESCRRFVRAVGAAGAASRFEHWSSWKGVPR
jgi:7-cyano-7-deazaguanine synthase